MYANVIWDGLEAIVPNTLANNWIIALVSWKIFFEILYIVYELSYIQTSEEHKDFISKILWNVIFRTSKVNLM